MRLPDKGNASFVFEAPAVAMVQASCAITAASTSLPSPTSPQAKRPLAGSRTRAPRCTRVLRLARTAGCFHMAVFMAGASKSGFGWWTRAAVLTKSSARPVASLASRSAVAATTTKASASLARLTCPTPHSAGSAKRSSPTGRPERVFRVRGATKRPALRVMSTVNWAACLRRALTTSAALYAAMPPATPTSMEGGLGTLPLGAGLVVALELAPFQFLHGHGGDLLAFHFRRQIDAFGQLAGALGGQHDALVFVVSALVLQGQ